MEAKYVSVWDMGVTVSSSCKFNPETKEVTDIESVDVDGLNYLDEEYVELPDGTQIKSFFREDGARIVDGQLID